MQLSEENLFKEMKRARKSKQQQGHLYIKNMREIFKNVFRLQNSMEEKQRKMKLLLTEKEKLSQLMKLVGCGI